MNAMNQWLEPMDTEGGTMLKSQNPVGTAAPDT